MHPHCEYRNQKSNNSVGSVYGSFLTQGLLTKIINGGVQLCIGVSTERLVNFIHEQFVTVLCNTRKKN